MGEIPGSWQSDTGTYWTTELETLRVRRWWFPISLLGTAGAGLPPELDTSVDWQALAGQRVAVVRLWGRVMPLEKCTDHLQWLGWKFLGRKEVVHRSTTTVQESNALLVAAGHKSYQVGDTWTRVYVTYCKPHPKKPDPKKPDPCPPYPEAA